MKRVLLVALSAGFLIAPTVASAQFAPVPEPVEYLTFVGKGDAVQATWGGVYLGPYLGSFDGGATSFAIYCVDYLHTAGDQTVRSTSLALGQGDADMGYTRLGEPDPPNGSYDRYRQGAYLSSLFDSWQEHALEGRAADKATIWSGLHAAIWDVTTGPAQPLGSGDTAAYREYFAGLTVPQDAGNGWYVLSGKGDYNGQEFLIRTPVSVPEPGTLLLMGSGLMLLVGVNRRRLKDVIENA